MGVVGEEGENHVKQELKVIVSGLYLSLSDHTSEVDLGSLHVE